MHQANAAPIPRAEKALGRANCLATDSVGDLVRITSNKVGNRYQVTRADPTGGTTIPAVAVILRKFSPTECVVQFHGPLPASRMDGPPAVYTTLSAGMAYFLGTDGLPAAPGDVNFPVAGGTTHFQQIGVANDAGELYLNLLEARLGGAGGGRYYKQTLGGAINGANTTFTTTVAFVHGGVGTEKLYYNGVLLEEGLGCDYEAQESGGAGTGFDTIEMLFTPKAGDKLAIDFVPDV